MTQFEITVNETKETKTVRTREEAVEWMRETYKILSLWGGEPTFTVVQIIAIKVDIGHEDWRL